MSNRKSTEARDLSNERRAQNRERTMIRHAERHGKAAARTAFSAGA